MIGSEAILSRLRKKRAHMWEQHVLLMIIVISIIVTRTIIGIIVVGGGVIIFVGRRDWRVQETYSMRSGSAFMLIFFHTQMNKS